MNWSFPEIFEKNSVKILEGAEGTKNDLSLMLQCEKGEQLGDPDFGVNLHKSKFAINPSLAKELAVDGIIEAQKFIGNVLFFRDNVKVEKTGTAKVDITVEAIFSEAINNKELVVIQGVDLE